jgi:hypothetical protein
MSLSPRTWLAAEVCARRQPGCKTATCGMHEARSNQIKPLNLVDQSQEGGPVVLAVSRVRWVTLRGKRCIPRGPADLARPAGQAALLRTATRTIRGVIRPAHEVRSEWNGA